MKKRGVLLLMSMIILSAILVYASVFSDINQGDFSGTYNLTFFNISGFIQLNASIFGNSTIISGNITELAGNETELISYWRFNESYWNGTIEEVKDVLGKNNGTARNGANITSGLFGNAGNFSGSSGTYTNEIQVANKEELNPSSNSFTITGWAKSITRGGNGYQLYVAKRDNIAGGKNGYYIGLLEGSGVKFVVGDGTNRVDTSYVPLDYTKWFHFAAVVNRTSNQSLIYINGTLGASASISNVGRINNSWNLSIGNDEGQALLGSTYQYPVKGQVDELAFWNYALNSSEIFGLYQKGINSTTNITTNDTLITSGTYESSVKDAGAISEWGTLSWNGLQQGQGITTLQGNVYLSYLEGNANDENNLNNGILRNSPTSVSGKNGLGYQLNGVNQYVEISDSNSLDLSSDFSLGLWVNFSSLPAAGQWQGIIAKGGAGDSPPDINHNFFLSFDNNMGWGSGIGITWGYEDSSGNNYQTRYQFTPDLGKWYHIAGVFNDSANTMTLYINGSQVSQTASATAVPVTNTHPVFIGRNINGSSSVYYLNAVVDDVFISNKSLSSGEIGEIYSGSTGDGLKFQIKTSNDNSSWSSYAGSDGTSSSYYTYPSRINTSNSRYIQYKTFFENLNFRLYNVSINYSAVSELSVTLDSPADNYLTNEYNNINITCSASSLNQLVNVTPYYSKFGWGESEPARSISGTTNTTTFTLNEISSTILWNCYFCDAGGNCAFSSLNRTIIGDILAPSVDLISPENNYIENSTQNLNFIFNATDNRASSLNCKLLINNSEAASNSSVISGIQTTISYSLANGNYTWKINCSDGLNSGLSDERNLTISVSSAYVPFWAKANTHTHTTNSDGDSSPAVVVGLYQGKEYSILAITDHGKVTNCTPFTNLSFICVNSEEWTSSKHMTRINVSAAYNNNIVNLQNAVNAANSEGGFAIIAHPNWSSTPWSVAELTSLQNYTAMEIYNKVIERLSPDPYSVSKWDEVLKTGKKIFGVAADDMHQVNVDLGYGFTKVYMPEFTKSAYINSMRTGYFYSSQGPSMDSSPFTLVCDELSSYHMGESANCSAVRISATISATNSSLVMRNISLIKDGAVINFTSCSLQNCSFSYSENVSSSGYYRIQAIDSGNKQIWSNPIWVTKIALPVVINVNFPLNNSNISDYTPLLNVLLNQQTSLWYNLNGGSNKTLCSDCSSYSGYILLNEGKNIVSVYANNSDNIVKESRVYVTLNFNKSMSEDFSDNSSVESTEKVFWNNGKMSMNASEMFGNFVFKPTITRNNITSFYVEWSENNTEYAKGEGQRIPIIFKYKFGSSSWIFLNSGEYIVNGSSVSGLNGNNLSVMIDFEKNSFTPVDLLDFRIKWTEFTVPLIFIPVNKTTTSSSAVILWTTDIESNSSIEYGNSPILGNFITDSNFVTYHSLTIPNLNQNTIYYFKIKSCTNDSCAEYPQSPYPVDSFTTQLASVPPVNPPSGGGGGGGGGTSINVTKEQAGIEVSGISDIVARAGELKTMSVSVKNLGKKFLNNCRLKGEGENSNLVSSKSIKGLSPGEIFEFIYTISVPSEFIEDADIVIKIACDEAETLRKFKISLPKNFLNVEIKSLEQSGNKLRFDYNLESNEEQDIFVEYYLKDSNGNKITSGNDSVILKDSADFEGSLVIFGNLAGEYILNIKASSKTNSAYAQESILIGEKKGLLGRAILVAGGGKIVLIALVIVLSVLVLTIIVKRIMKKQIHEDKTGYVKLKLGK